LQLELPPLPDGNILLNAAGGNSANANTE